MLVMFVQLLRTSTHPQKFLHAHLSAKTNTVERAILSEPANLANITGINGAAVALKPRVIRLANPVPEIRIVISRLHVHLLAQVETLVHTHLLLTEIGAGQANAVEGRLLNMVVNWSRLNGICCGRTLNMNRLALLDDGLNGCIGAGNLEMSC